ncbi:hypothetical protein niasHS_016212 [Heterodera schachtii]|uniref:Twin-arginine translocation signal domain-containing protein n=1 Tax=Heterodera schachtii TaxID=97005 RepID=A0ABD2HNQ8_HETSC
MPIIFCQMPEKGANSNTNLIRSNNDQLLQGQHQAKFIQKRRRRGTFLRAALGGAAVGGGVALLAKAFRQRKPPGAAPQRNFMQKFG